MKNYGINPTLINVEYVRPNKKKGIKECFKVVYINDDGVVKYTEEEAKIPIYITKPEYRNHTYNKPEERIERCNKVMTLISEVNDVIVKESGPWGEAIRDRAKALEDWKYERNLLKWPYCYGCDFLPEFYFMHEWFSKYKLTMPHLSKGFMDIETDIIDYTTDLNDIPNSAYAPVNLITIILEDQKEAYQFILRPYVPKHDGYTEEEYKERYALYERQLAAHKKMFSDIPGHIKDLHDRFDATYGYLNYNIREYENEIDLIADAFRYINTRKPNFMGIWNMRFDIQYLYYRIIALGYDPESIMCSPEIPNKVCKFKQDNTTYDIPKQFDFFHCSSFTQYICQMRMYASVRKSQHKLRSVALNKIANRELKDKKVEYPENENIKTFAYADWRLFCIYNIKDVLLQLGIERKVNDMVTYYMRAMSNMTPYYKIFRETHLLRDVREISFEQQGWVQGNNLNTLEDDYRDETERRFYEGEEDDEDDNPKKLSFKGAINAEPTMNDYVGERLLGKRTNNLFLNLIDFDMGAFYPSSKIISNMDAITLIYKAAFYNNEFESGQYSNKSLNQKYEEIDKNGNRRPIDITGEAVNTYVSGNILTFGYNYLNFPNLNELEALVVKALSKH